jgi:hypothetical protein
MTVQTIDLPQTPTDLKKLLSFVNKGEAILLTEGSKPIEDAKRGWLELAVADGDPIPEPAPMLEEQPSGKFTVRVARGRYHNE